MMSINGMISIRARLCGTGEASLILWNLVRRAGHGESDGNVNLGNCSRSKSPLPKRAGGSVIQNGIAGALRDGTASDVPASCIHLGDDHATTSDVPRARLWGYWGRGAYKASAFARDIDMGPGALIGVNFCAFCGCRGGGVLSSTIPVECLAEEEVLEWEYLLAEELTQVALRPPRRRSAAVGEAPPQAPDVFERLQPQ